MTTEPKMPALPWCFDCWKLAAEIESDLPDTCPRCNGENIDWL